MYLDKECNKVFPLPLIVSELGYFREIELM